jgi:protein translocase SecG subunit
MLFSVILSIHVVACVLVILVVLLQSGKGAGFSGIFGGGGSDAVFSAPSGSQFIRKGHRRVCHRVLHFVPAFDLLGIKAGRTVRDAPIFLPRHDDDHHNDATRGIEIGSLRSRRKKAAVPPKK